MTTHSNTLSWKIPWMEEPSRLQPMGSLRVGHDWATSLSLFTFMQLHFHFSLSCIGEGNGNPLQCSCLENPREGGAWWAAVSGVAQGWTWLKWLSSKTHNIVCHIYVGDIYRYMVFYKVLIDTVVDDDEDDTVVIIHCGTIFLWREKNIKIEI